jgi:hypothetical protein
MAHDVFICHSSTDRTVANAICSKLEQNRVRCWIAPRDVIPGLDYAQAIVEAISGSKLTVLVFSDNSNQSRHVHREVERAVSHGIPILPFRLDDVTPSPSLEYFISDAHWLDAMTPPMEDHLDQLVGTVHLLLERINSEAEGGSTAAARGGGTAVLAPPAPPVERPPVPTPGRHLPSWWRWALGAAVLAVVAVVVAVVALGGGGGKSGTSPKPGGSATPTAAASTPAAPPGTAAVKLGTTVSLAGMDAGSKAAVTVLKVVDPATSTDDIPGVGDRFVAVQIKIRNTGSRVFDDSPDNCVTVRDTTGHSYEATTVLSVSAGPVFEATVTMGPGKEVTGYTVVEVPAKVKIVAVHFTLDSGYADQTGIWSVG